MLFRGLGRFSGIILIYVLSFVWTQPTFRKSNAKAFIIAFQVSTLFLYNGVALLRLSDSYPQPCPYAIRQRRSIRTRKHQRRRVEKVRVGGPLVEPQMME